MIPVCPESAHEAMKADDAVWSTLKFVSIWLVEDEGEVLIHDEIRNCTCNSSLQRPVRAGGGS